MSEQSNTPKPSERKRSVTAIVYGTFLLLALAVIRRSLTSSEELDNDIAQVVVFVVAVWLIVYGIHGRKLPET